MTSRIELKDLRLGQLIAELAGRIPDREALVAPMRGERMTFSQLNAEATTLARGLASLGIVRGDRVALWAPSLPEWIVLQFALAKIGAILVTVNTGLKAHELAYLLGQSESRMLIAAPGFRDLDYLATIEEVVPEIFASAEWTSPRLPFLEFVSIIDRDPARIPPGAITYSRMKELAGRTTAEQIDVIERSLDFDDVINMQYTSGTTGFPKGVMLSHRNILNNGYWVGDYLGYTTSDRLCCQVPLFHCFGCVVAVLGAYTHGATLVLMEYFDARKVLEALDAERCTAVYGVPTMFLAELEDPEFSRFDLSSLRCGVMAGALCPEPLMRRVMTEMHCPEIIIAYGMTETSPTITLTSRDDTVERRTRTVGKPIPGVEVAIADPVSGEALPPGRSGELWTRSEFVMKGYYNQPEVTRETIAAGGWLRTGDQAMMDEDGYVRITGRIKDLIIRGGENISPKEIEDVIREMDGIADVSVYAVRDEFFGEEVAASVRLKSQAKLSAEAIREYCRSRLAKFKVPRYVRFVETFPMTPSGKIQKYKLREEHNAELPAAERNHGEE